MRLHSIVVSLLGSLALVSTVFAAEPSREGTSPPKKAFMIVTGVVHDRAAFAEGYAKKLPPIYAQYGGKYLAAGKDPISLEGKAEFSSYVISEWPSVAAAQAFWNSLEYAPIRQERIDKKWGDFNVWIFEGLAVPSAISPMAASANASQPSDAKP